MAYSKIYKKIMRELYIDIEQRPGITDDNTIRFSGQSENDIYQLISLNLNYSVVSSQVTSMLIMGMNEPLSKSNEIYGGQPISITDNGETVFQGFILQARYVLAPLNESEAGGMFFYATLAPSIYQLALTPVIFDDTQANQIEQLTGLQAVGFLVGGIDQQTTPAKLLDYMISNTLYKNFFQNTISPEDLPNEVFVMVNSPTDTRDTVLRSSIDFCNTVLYQNEAGTIVIRQLDANRTAPFDLSLQNLYQSSNEQQQGGKPYAALLTYEYTDNSATTPSVISNTFMLDPKFSATGKAAPGVLTYAPAPKYFPQVGNLAKTGWFVGQIGWTQVNSNIVNNPTASAVLRGFQSAGIDNYMIATQPSGVEAPTAAAYQELLTAKQMGMALSGYAGILGTISLDDLALQNIDLGEVVGTVTNIQNSSLLPQGLIATVSRTYSAQGSYMSFNIVPLGSFTGYWKN